MTMKKRVLLVGWDAADWRVLHPLIDTGEMPVLGSLVERGVSGDLLSPQPLVTATQWVSLATGKRAWQHGICHPLQRGPEGGRAVSVGAAGRQSAAVWEILAKAGRRCLVTGWPATHGETTRNVSVVSDRYAEPTAPPGVKPWPPAHAGTYWPRDLGSRLDELRMSPEEVRADIVAELVPEWRRVDQKRDPRLGQLRLFLATDFSHQAALLRLMREREWDFAALRFPALGALSQVFAAFQTPRGPEIDEQEFALFQHVIRGACRLLDRLLGELVRAAGEQTGVLVVSPYGVRSATPGRLETGNPGAWKSPLGIIAAAGPGIAADALIYGAGALDVTPTILTWLGVPIGDDMEGRILLECFADPPPVERVPSWESPRLSPKADEIQEAGVRREILWNRGQSFLDAGRHAEALPLLEQLFRAFPERAEWAHALFQCQLHLGRLAEAEETLEVLLDSVPPGAPALVTRAELLVAQAKLGEARALVDQARRLNPTNANILRRLGLLLLRLREWRVLADLARRALELDATDALAWMALAEAELRMGKPEAAEQSAWRAIQIKYFLPRAHFVLARALVAQSRWPEARQALATLHRLQPGNRAAEAYTRRLA